MRATAFCLSLSLAAITAAADPPPLRAPIDEIVEGVACASDPSQTYTLYLPPGFTSERRWPVLLVFDPRGRSVLAAELFREAARDYGWIIASSNDTRSDGPMEPNVKALNALWPEVHTRLPADFRRIYAAGFSGGGAVAFVLSRSTHELAGIVACGARYLPDDLKSIDAPIFSTAGNTDFNYREMYQVDEFLGDHGVPHRLVIFEGAHSWMPPQVGREAVEWFELMAMQRGLRALDPDLVESLFSADMASAQAVKSEGRLLEAARRYGDIKAAYAGLRETAAAGRAAQEIERRAEFRRQRKELKRWDDFESQYLEEMNRQLAELRFAEITPRVPRMARGFRIEELERRALQPGVEGVTAQRVLNTLATGLVFYLPREFLAAGQYDRLAASLELGLRIRGADPVGWYNLACARARTKHPQAAVEALERAIEAGFARLELLATDPDLDSLRDREDFKALVAAQNSN